MLTTAAIRTFDQGIRILTVILPTSKCLCTSPKIYDWMWTMFRSRVRFTVPMIY